MLTLIGVVVVLSIALLVRHRTCCSDGRRRVPSDALLVLEVGGELAENAPTDVVTYLRGAQDADGPRRSSTTCERPRSIAACAPCC